MKRFFLPLFAIYLAQFPLPSLGAGSWVASETGPRISLAGTTVPSRAMAPPAPVARDHQITSVNWRFSLPDAARQRVTVRLCHPDRCIPLHNERGSSEGLAGLNADRPLRFHFRLTDTGPAIQAQGLQVIVNYRQG